MGSVRLPPKRRKAKPKAKKKAKAKPKRKPAPLLADHDSLVVEVREQPAERSWKNWHGRWSMRLEYVNCGRCPKAHGPYWYAYKRERPEKWGEGGKLHKVYVGKKYDPAKGRALLQARGLSVA